MTKILITFFTGFMLFMNAQDLSGLRLLLQKAGDSPAATKTLVEDSDRAFKNTKKPVYEAFYAVGNFFLAKHAMNPLNKYSYFKKGRNSLENAVKKDPKNLEIRFMRYISQSESPAFLGYNKDLYADKNFILSEYRKSTDLELVQRIKTHFKI